jgi:O-antigen ligase
MKTTALKIFFDELKEMKGFAIFFFLIFPFISIPYFQDEDLFIKNLALSVFTLIWAFVSLKKKEAPLLGRNLSVFLLLFVGFLISLLLSYKSIINNEEALAAILQYVLPFLFLYLISQNKNQLGVSNWAQLSAYTLILLSIIVFLQIVFSSISKGVLVIDYSIRATLSNKNFVSEVLVLLMPFVLIGYTQEQRRKRLYAFALLLGLFTLIILQTISAWLVLLIAFVIFLPLYFYFFKPGEFSLLKMSKKWKALIFLFTALLIGLFCFTGLQKPLKTKMDKTLHYFNADFKEIIVKDDSSNVNSVYERFLLWRNTKMLGDEKPMIGIGLSNWRFLYPKFGIGGAYHLNSGAMHFEHPHNEFLLLYSETGLLSLIGLGLLITFVLVIAAKRFREEDGQTIYFMFCGVISFFILALFSYPMHRPYAVALLMLMFFLILNKGSERLFEVPKWGSALLLLLSLFMVRVQFARALGNYHMNSALHEQAINRFPKMLKELRLAENDYYQIDNTGTPINWYKGFAHYYTGSDSAIYYFKLAEDQNPYHLQILSDLGASYENHGEHAKAITYFNKVVAITPLFPSAHLNLAIAQYNLGALDSALAQINSSKVGSEYEQKVLITILSSYAKQMSDSASDIVIKQCLAQISMVDSTLLKINKLALRDNLYFRQVLLNECPISK